MKKQTLTTVLLICAMQTAAIAAEDVEFILKQGQMQLQSERYDQAMSSFDKCIQTNPDCMRARWYRAVLCGKKGEYQKALQDYNMLISQAPANAVLYRARAGIHLLMLQNQLALNDCNKSISLDPNDAKAYDFRGAAHLHLGQSDKAEEDRQKALELDTARVDLFANPKLAMYAPAQPKSNEATGLASAPIAAAAQSLKLQSQYAMFSGEFDKSLSLIDKLLKTEPHDLELKRNHAICLHQLGKNQEALLEINNLIKIKPSVAEFYALRAEFLLSLNKVPMAFVDAQRAIKLDTKLAYGHQILGSVYFANKQYDKAMLEFTEALKIAPRSAECLKLMANTYLALKDTSKAVVYYSQAISLNNRDVDSYLARARCYEGNKQYDYALADYKSIIKVQPSNLAALEGRIKCAFELRQYALVLEDTTKLLTTPPGTAAKTNSENYLLMRARAFEKLGSKERCLMDLNTLLKEHPGNIEALKDRVRLTTSDSGSASTNDQVLADLDKTIAADTSNIGNYYKRIKILKEQHKLEQVISDASAILAMNPTETQARRERAEAAVELSKFDQAVQDLDLLIKQTPESKLYRLRAKANQGLGKASLSIRDQEMANDLDKAATH